MLEQKLKEKLSYPRAYRSTRLEVASWVIENPESFPFLITFCFSSEKKLSYRATWILEYVCIQELSFIYLHFDFFFLNLPNVTLHQATRPMAKICQLITLKYYKDKDIILQKHFSAIHKEQMVAVCFDWLLSDQKVACKVFSMTALFYLGTEYTWIHSELEITIKHHMAKAQPAFKARGKQTLLAIQKYRKNIH